MDRYAYTDNNPVNHTDPSGHEKCASSSANNCYFGSDLVIGKKIDQQLDDFGITLTVQDGYDSNYWNNFSRKYAVFKAAMAVGAKFAQASGGTAADAFKSTYGPVHLQYGCGDDCKSRDKNGKPYGNEGGLYSSGLQKNNGNPYYLIKIGTLLDDGGQRGILNVVHELGHTYDYRVEEKTGAQASAGMSSSYRNSLRPNGYWANGVFTEDKTVLVWQMHPDPSSGETYADIFVAWTFNAWNTNPDNAGAVTAAQAWMP